MSGVKQSTVRLLARFALFAAPAMAAIAGCANSDLARFAPPGIVKYEDLAGDQPPSLEITARIAERRAEPDSGVFPVLSETPGEAARPKKRSSASLAAEITELDNARKAIEADLATDRAGAQADAQVDLPEKAQTLKDRITRDNEAAARERRQKLTPPAAESPATKETAESPATKDEPNNMLNNKIGD